MFALLWQTWRTLPDLSSVAAARKLWELPKSAVLPSTSRLTDLSAVARLTRLADEVFAMFHRFLAVPWWLSLLLAVSGPTLALAQEGTPDTPLGNGFAEQGPPTPECLPATRLPFDDPPAERAFRMVWGVAEIDGYLGHRTAPNGLVYHPDYGANLDFNIWVWPAMGLYLYNESLFWMGTTHELNFTKRELDLDIGVAWNYYGRLEARIFGYSDNNLNRGVSPEQSAGYDDGFCLENRFYLNSIYQALGTSDYDQAKATFVSLGYLPTKTLTGADGMQFHPVLFARAYLTWEVVKESCYLYADTTFIIERDPFDAKLLNTDLGAALRPFPQVPRLEFRAGCLDVWDLQVGNARPVGYLSIRYVF
jgi:hypothetical protein